MVYELNLVFDTEFVRSKQLGKRHQHLGFTQFATRKEQAFIVRMSSFL